METREQILAAAAAVFSQHGFRGSTTRRIADAAGVNEVTIFRYFGSKDVLLQEAIQKCGGTPFDLQLPEVPLNPVAELTAWAMEIHSHLHERRSLIRKCMGDIEERPEMGAVWSAPPKRATNAMCVYFRKLRERGFTDDTFEPIVAAAVLRGAIFHDAMSREMMPDAFPAPEPHAVASYVALVLRGLGVSADRLETSSENSGEAIS